MNKLVTYLAHLFVLAAAYYIGGRLGLLLLIPPGQATAFWPPSGIALAGLLLCGPKCWPGVFLGALGTSLSHADSWTMDSLQLAAVIAAGATVQAGLGAALVRRALNAPYVLERIRDILKLLALGGVASCLVSATIATYALQGAGVVPPEAFRAHWFTWWAGDVLGVVVFAPVMLLLFATQTGEAAVKVQRKAVVALSMMVMFGLVVYLYALARGQYEDARQLGFDKTSERLALQFENELGVYLNTLVAVERFIASSEYVSADEFEHFTSRFFDAAPGLSGLSWVPKVPHAERASFEKSIREQGYPDFEIRRRFELGDMRISEERDFYLPLAYVVPYESNAPAHGFDINGEDPVVGEARQRALAMARDRGVQIATARFPIVQAENQLGFIVYQPVYDAARYTNSVDGRRDSLIGYANGIFLLPVLCHTLAQNAAGEFMNVILRDQGADRASRLLYDSRTPDHKASVEGHYDFESMLTHTVSVDMAGRDWSLTFVEDADALSAGMNWNLWAVALGGVLYCGLFGVFMLVVTARTAVVQRVVDARTGELASANAELEEFAYRTSHDLRSPVVSALGLLDVAEEGLAAQDYEMTGTSLRHAKSALGKLNSLIEDILQLTQTAHMEEKPEEVNFGDILADSVEKLSFMDGFDTICVDMELNFDKKLVVKPIRLRAIVENLLSNAVKYQDRDKKRPFVRIETLEEGDDFVLRISDNGLGIPKDRQQDIFGMFKRFHPRTAFGSGLGLYLVQKSVHVLGGTIEFTDPGEGVCFTVRIPLV